MAAQGDFLNVDDIREPGLVAGQLVDKCIRITLAPSPAMVPRDVNISTSAIAYNLKRRMPEEVTTAGPTKSIAA